MDNREKILQCALELFYAKGYDATGVQEIAQTAGVTKPTLYYYFGSKYGLLTSVLEKYNAPIQKGLEELRDNPPPLEEGLFQMASLFLREGMRNQASYSLQLSMMYAPRESESYRAVNPVMRLHYEVVQTILRQDERTCENAGELAINFTGLINHTLLGYYSLPERDEVISDQQVRRLVQMYLYGALHREEN